MVMSGHRNVMLVAIFEVHKSKTSRDITHFDYGRKPDVNRLILEDLPVALFVAHLLHNSGTFDLRL